MQMFDMMNSLILNIIDYWDNSFIRLTCMALLFNHFLIPSLPQLKFEKKFFNFICAKIMGPPGVNILDCVVFGHTHSIFGESKFQYGKGKKSVIMLNLDVKVFCFLMLDSSLKV